MLSRGLVMEQTGEGVKEKDFQLPAVGLGEVVVRMEVAAVNALDVMYVQGLCPMAKRLPSVPGLEVFPLENELNNRL